MYIEIFKEIVDIIHHDYAGCKDKNGWDRPDEFLETIKQQQNDLTPQGFVELVEDYLADLKDPHMFFSLIGEESEYRVGFKVRRYEDALYVTKSTKEKRLEVGDKIIALDEYSVPELLEIHTRRLLEKKAEREEWRDILKMHKFAQVQKVNGQSYTIELSRYEKDEYQPEYYIKPLNSETLYLKMTDFMNPDSINDLIKKHEADFNQLENLIIDVRLNLGGSDAAFYNLIPYLFPQGEIHLGLDEDYEQEFNCTERNTDLTIKKLNQFLDEIDAPHVKKMLKSSIKAWEDNRGKGFVKFNSPEEEQSEPLKGKEYPKQIIVLTDVNCASAGDIFVEVCKKSDKVKVVGRATMGVNDYSNLKPMTWNNQFELMYPTSRLCRIDRGEGMTGIGIQPDVYIPWTSEHLERDVDMEKALELLGSTEKQT